MGLAGLLTSVPLHVPLWPLIKPQLKSQVPPVLGGCTSEAQPPPPLASHAPPCCLQRYDPVTIGIGSLLVTAYCYFVHGQSLEEALNLTFASTVVGMVSI